MTEPVERRPIAGTRLTTSILGLSLNLEPGPSPDQDRAAAAGVRKVLADGVTTFDLTSAMSLPRAAGLAVSALPEADDRFVFWVRYTPPSSLPASGAVPRSGPRASNGTSSDSREEYVAAIRALNGRGSVLIDWDPEEGSAEEGASSAQWLSELEKEGLVAGRSRHLPPQRLSRIRPDSTPSDPLVSSEISLLDPDSAQALDALFRGRPGSVLVRDPFAGGLLDGSRISSGISDRVLPSRPIDLRALHAEFDPVLRLAPLTRDRRRTLAQAAVQYALRWSWTAAVMVPLSSVSGWSEIRAALSQSPPTEQELAALGLIRPPGPERGEDSTPSG